MGLRDTGLILALHLIICVLPAGADTYEVLPDGTGDFPTIQAAVDAAQEGDRILLGDGVFRGMGNRDVVHPGTAFTIESASGNPESCVIDCEGSAYDRHRAFLFEGGGSGAELRGVRIVHGWPSSGLFPPGGAILCAEGTSPTIIDCVFEDNHAEDAELAGAGGAIFSSGETVLIDCTFIENTASSGGSAVCGGFARIENCTFIGNVVTAGDGTVYFMLGPARVDNCTFYGNHASRGVGVSCPPDAIEISNTIIAFSGEGSAILALGEAPILVCCDLFGNAGGDWTEEIVDQLGTAGNISADPLFCDPEFGDLSLHADSPCLPYSAPNPECGLSGAWGEGCPATPIRATTWGGLKARFRVVPAD